MKDGKLEVGDVVLKAVKNDNGADDSHIILLSSEDRIVRLTKIFAETESKEKYCLRVEKNGLLKPYAKKIEDGSQYFVVTDEISSKIDKTFEMREKLQRLVFELSYSKLEMLIELLKQWGYE